MRYSPLMLPVAAFAAGSVQELTLADARRLMLENSPELHSAQYSLEAAQADIKTAQARPNPQFSLDSSRIDLHEGIGGGGISNKRIDSVARIDQTFERGDKRRLRTAAATAGESAARADLDDALRTANLSLEQAYYELKQAQEVVRTTSELADLERQSLDAARLRQRDGDISNIDVARLEIETARAQADLADANAALHAAQIALARQIGVVGEENEFVASDAWPAPAEAPANAAKIDDRPDVRAAAARESQAQTNVSLAKSLRTRDVSFGVQYEHDLTPGGIPNTWGLGISVPLFIGNKYQGELGRALAEHRGAQESLRETRLTAVADREQAQNQLLAASSRVQLFQSQIIARAREAAEAAQFAYSRGALSLTDLLDARRAMQSVNLDSIAAQADYAKSLAAWRASNLIDTQDLKLVSEAK